MDAQTRTLLKNDLAVLQAQIIALDAHIASVQMAGTMPIVTSTGPITIPAFQLVASSLRLQKDAIENTLKFIDRLLAASK